MNRAVFLDRDGVVNPNVFNPDTDAWESPHREEDFELFPWTVECIRRLSEKYLVFVVSNQPSYAKGKTSLDNIKNIHKKMVSILTKNHIDLTDCFYCYHHPQGIVPEFSVACECRKPSPYFLINAQQRYRLDMKSSWMVGDRETDIQCGKSAGVKTIFILPEGANPTENCKPDFVAPSLSEAVQIIFNN